MKNQRQQILESNAPTRRVAGTLYKGQPPQFRMMPDGRLWKVAKGIPFIRI